MAKSVVPAAYKLDLSDDDIFRYKARILSRGVETPTGCLLWSGERGSDGYGLFRFTYDKERYKVRVHRFLFFIDKRIPHYDKMAQVSHICHNKLCIKMDHLNLEDAATNTERNICSRTPGQRCIGHNGAPNCILHP